MVVWYCTSYELRIPKFIKLRFTFHEQRFQCFVNTCRIGNVDIACLNKTSSLRRNTAEILKDPSYIRCELKLKCSCIFMVGKHCLRFRMTIEDLLDQMFHISKGQLSRACSIDKFLYQVLLFSQCSADKLDLVQGLKN